jgi:asparagine synthase (glutamine-hydrolysing)
MSAIVGLYRRDNRPIDRMSLDRMAASLAHRGRDAAGEWNRGAVGLGHRMLWSTPESLHEDLPLTNKNGDAVITADARIDNRDELITALGLSRWSHGGISDSELILRAYERWGEVTPQRLLGDFAFAIWDERRQALFCARDHCGAKPFYYHQSDRVFGFASEIKALLSTPEVPRRLNPMKVGDYLAGIFEDQASTFYRDIFRLPAGHSMTVSRDNARVQAYSWLDPSREIRLRSDDEYAEAFRERFTEAVRCRLRSAFAVGGLLSGGLDSSSIVGTARRVLVREEGRGLHTFSAIFPGLPETDLKGIDERRFVQAVLATGGVTPHYVRADRVSPLSDLGRMQWHEDEAFLAPNLYMHWALYRAAHEQRIRVLLDGVDGDTTVSHGLENLGELFRAGKFRALGREVVALSRHHDASARRIFWELGLKPMVPDRLQHWWRALRRPGQPSSGFNTTINPVFARRVALADRARAFRGAPRGSARTARESHWRGLTSPLLPYVLEIANKAAAAFSLEPRYPFFDRRLMEFCLALPPEQKLAQGWTRVVMRRAMAGILPDEVRWRVGKANLSSNFKRGMLDRDRSLLDDVILRDPAVIEEYVDVSALREVYRRYASQPMSEDDALTVYSAVTLALWLRRTGLTS